VLRRRRELLLMSLTPAVLTLVGVAVLAFANGASDVSKGVATLAVTLPIAAALAALAALVLRAAA
jgi:hypothetical protein